MKVLGICGGAGVILYPFRKYLIANVEPRATFHSPGEKQWYSNFDCPIYRDFTSVKIRGTTIDLILGAPDCGHSSILSYSRAKKFGNPQENKSLNLFIRGIKLYKPKIFLMENLPALLKTYKKKGFKTIFSEYDLRFIESSVANFGNSQVTRVRLLIIGVRKGLNKEISSNFKCPTLKRSKLSYSDALVNDLDMLDKQQRVKLCHIKEDLSEIITIYARKKLKLSVIKNAWLHDFKGKSRWEVKDRNFTTAPGVYRNLPGGYPFTARKTNRQFNAKGEMMSPRELARIQGLKDDFKIYYDGGNKQYWINKGRVAVTKCPPFEVGLWAYKRLKRIYKQNLI